MKRIKKVASLFTKIFKGKKSQNLKVYDDQDTTLEEREEELKLVRNNKHKLREYKISWFKRLYYWITDYSQKKEIEKKTKKFKSLSLEKQQEKVNEMFISINKIEEKIQKTFANLNYSQGFDLLEEKRDLILLLEKYKTSGTLETHNTISNWQRRGEEKRREFLEKEHKINFKEIYQKNK